MISVIVPPGVTLNALLLALPATSLFVELFIVLVLAAVTAYWSRRTRLTAQANFAAVLVAFGYWTLGGMPWLIPSFAIYIMHPLLVRLPEALRRSIGPRAILGVATASLPWFLLYKAGLMAFEAAFYPYCVALAGHLTMISVIRRRVLGPGGAHWLELGRWSMLSTLVYMVVFMAVAGTGRETQLALVLCWPIVLLTGHGFDRLMPKGGTTRRWVIEAASAIVAASIGWLGYATLSGQL